MGMFDYIKCETYLPDGFDPSGIEFQTKDLDCALDVLIITAEGRLVRNYREFESNPEDQKIFDTNYHGFVTFYSSNISGSGPKGFTTINDEKLWSRRYTAKFTDGKLVCITLDSDTSI